MSVRRRLVGGIVFALAVLAIVPVASAMASVTIESSPGGTTTNNTTPTFSGSTSDTTDDVTLNIYSGTAAKGPPAQTLATTLPPAGGTWSLSVTSPLEEGTYTAQAEQTELAGLGEVDFSAPVTFTVVTASPTVTLTGPPKLSKVTKPSFSGEASDTTEVVVHILNAANEQVGSATAKPTSGTWSTSGESALADGSYTAYATQASSVGNPEGKSSSVEFTINTASPKVTLNQPKSPSNDTTPSFTGTASDTTQVTVRIYSGPNAKGTVVSEATAAGNGGAWSSGEASPVLSSGEYTAVATQPSSLENPEGKSNPVTFIVDTSSPTVTLNQPESPSKDTTPSFTGTASDTTQVTIRIYAGSKAEGTVVSKATAAGSGGAWTSGEASPALSSGTYTAVATQPSSLGNPDGVSAPVTFTVSTASPEVTLNQPKSPSNDTTPVFTGFASDTTPVTIEIYAGSKAQGTPVASAEATGTGGDWTSGEAGPALSSGQYTAVASQPSSLGNPAGISAPVTFIVETGPPHVTLNQPKTPSNDTTPPFTGTASDTTAVTIKIYAGASASGTVVSSATATGTGGAWSSGEASPALPTGEYTAVASQESSLLGNPTGTSNTVTFIVDTRSPTVTLNAPPSPSNNTTPSFTGTGSATTQVTIQIYEGTKAKRTEISKALATGTGGAWSSGKASPSLSSGTYTAVASQPSPLGNPAGMSAAVTFTVNTNPPVVTLNSPAVRSNNTTPAFSGTASDTTQVTVHVYKGSKAEGTEVSLAVATSKGGSWTSGHTSPALVDGQYTAIATEPSSLENAAGKSAPVTFTVDTTAPTVSLAQPTTPSKNRTPSFSGTASEATQVTVHIYEGSKAEGTEISTALATGTGGSWSSGAASPALPLGKRTYTAVASQESSLLGNPTGVSSPVTFIVDTTSPTVTLTQPKTPSNNMTPSFAGSASDTEEVVVHIYEGSKAEGTEISKALASGTGGAWSSGAASPVLPSGKRTYTALATQKSSLGNPEGKSLPVTFVVDTTSPVVTITSPLNGSASNNQTPAFKGTATGTKPISIKIYEGPPAEHREVSTATATVTSSKWESTHTSPALAAGTHKYTAVATEESPLGNLPGTTEVTFTVNTLPPKVTLNEVLTPSKNTTPSFTGTATDTTPVTIQIYQGTKPEGTVLATAAATGTGGAWTSGNAKPALPEVKHTYTAIAIEPSSLGNPAGKSTPVTFVVDPAAPHVTLNAPPALSNDPTPSFTGTASDTTPVLVRIYAGETASGTVVAEAKATGTGGGWSSAPAAPALPDGQYTARAVQSTLLGDEGPSLPVTFTVDTVAPAVTLTNPANGTSTGGGSQLVQGTASQEEDDLPAITVQLFPGAAITEGQSPAQSITVSSVSGTWSTTFAGLSPGTYTVRAQQSDEAGNVGISNTSTFTVIAPSSAGTAPAASPPTASFSWFPPNPSVGESVTLVSSSTDAASPITAFAWDVAGAGPFSGGGPGISTSFSTPGNHLVRLRVTDANGLSSVATEAIPVNGRTLPLIQPFPVVRITSIETRSGIRLRLLGISAAPGTEITVRCRGRGCPVKSQSHLAAAGKGARPFVVFRRFQRALAAGVVLEIMITKPGEIGKYTRLVVRRGRLPVRFDACLVGTATKPIGCPSS
jgi:large repetitive protein